jgi:3-deoxy-D-manno-octulosonic-acid transferase
MGRSLSLAAYRALSRRQSHPKKANAEPRPETEIIWAHATSRQRFSALCDLGQRFKSARPGLRILISIDPAQVDPVPTRSDGCDWVESLGTDHPAAVRQFLAHWKPNVCLWTGGNLMPNLISSASEQGIPLILLDVGEGELQTGWHRWLPDLKRTSLECFDRIFVNSDEAANGILRLGIADDKVVTTDRLRNSTIPPACNEDDWVDLMETVSGRPVWLAAQVQKSEFDAVLTAHVAALRLIHRLLLVVSPAQADDLADLRASLAQTSLRTAEWAVGDKIEDSVQVLISPDASDLGLWYRVAPLTFMASSLAQDATGANPSDAASFGSAILYGPNVRDHMETYARLAAAGAARVVRGTEGLGAGVVQLIAPDKAAAMALKGWEVMTEGASLTDNLTDLVQDLLDVGRAHHASS